MSELGNFPPGSTSEQQGPDGLLFTGDYVRQLSPDQITAIGDFASRMFGVEMRQIEHINRDLTENDLVAEEQGEEALPPVPMTLEEMTEFAISHDGSKVLARNAWNSLWSAHGSYHNEECDLPDIDFIQSEKEFDVTSVDLRSVYNRLWATEVNPLLLGPSPCSNCQFAGQHM